MKPLFLVLGILAAGFLWERSASSALRVKNEALRAESQEAEQLAAENRELPGLRAAAAAVEKSDHTELLRLRNQIRQLRDQKQEADKLRAANQRLAGEIQAGKFAPRRLADMEGAVPREKWAFSGFATPEAAVQSFLVAVASGDPEQFVRCMTPEGADSYRKEMARDPVGFRKQFEGEFGKFGKLSAFRITGTRPKAGDADRIEVLIQVVTDGESMPMPLRRIGTEWKLGD